MMCHIDITKNLARIDLFLDYIPFASTLSNFINIIEKTFIDLIYDKNSLSNHYAKHLSDKSYKRCICLLVPVFGNLAVGIADFTKKKHDDNVLDNHIIKNPIKIPQIDVSSISLTDIKRIDVVVDCSETYPCQHTASVTLKDGRIASGVDTYDICSIISDVSEEIINPGSQWNARDVKEHFIAYSTSDIKPSKEVLNNLVFKNN